MRGRKATFAKAPKSVKRGFSRISAQHFFHTLFFVQEFLFPGSRLQGEMQGYHKLLRGWRMNVEQPTGKTLKKQEFVPVGAKTNVLI